jgi:hypothetical protein
LGNADIAVLGAVMLCWCLQVRVYQFSETAKRMDCVIFESVGSRSNNESLTVEVSLLEFAASRHLDLGCLNL